MICVPKNAWNLQKKKSITRILICLASSKNIFEHVAQQDKKVFNQAFLYKHQTIFNSNPPFQSGQNCCELELYK